MDSSFNWHARDANKEQPTGCTHLICANARKEQEAGRVPSCFVASDGSSERTAADNNASTLPVYVFSYICMCACAFFTQISLQLSQLSINDLNLLVEDTFQSSVPVAMLRDIDLCSEDTQTNKKSWYRLNHHKELYASNWLLSAGF